MAVGTATAKVRKEKMAPASADWLETNRWWPQTRKPMKAMATDETAMGL
jgi:hypothetical protein